MASTNANNVQTEVACFGARNLHKKFWFTIFLYSHHNFYTLSTESLYRLPRAPNSSPSQELRSVT